MAQRSVTRAARRQSPSSSHRRPAARSPAAAAWGYPAFSDLMRRFLVAQASLDLARQSFGDLTGMSDEHARAGLVVGEVTKELDKLYNDLDTWGVKHEHVAKAVQS